MLVYPLVWFLTRYIILIIETVKLWIRYRYTKWTTPSRNVTNFIFLDNPIEIHTTYVILLLITSNLLYYPPWNLLYDDSWIRAFVLFPEVAQRNTTCNWPVKKAIKIIKTQNSNSCNSYLELNKYSAFKLIGAQWAL